MSIVAVHDPSGDIGKIMSRVSIQPTSLAVEFWFRGTHDQAERVIVQWSSFEAVAKAMMTADSETAIKAFGAALQRGMQPTPTRNSLYYEGCEDSGTEAKSKAVT